MTEHQQKSDVSKGEPLEQLLARHDDFLRFLQKRVESRAVAEDILQSAFVRGIEKASTLRDQESIVAWFYRMLRNAVIDHYRSRDSSAHFLDEWPEGLDIPGQPVEFVKNEICRCVNNVLVELKPEYRDALQSVDIEEHPVTEFAEQAGITANNANVRLHRAREALRKQVRTVCGTCADHRCVDCTCKHPRT
jgi:RNA polymerase sigma-70 factor (ECF subfamily)